MSFFSPFKWYKYSIVHKYTFTTEKGKTSVEDLNHMHIRVRFRQDKCLHSEIRLFTFLDYAKGPNKVSLFLTKLILRKWGTRERKKINKCQ